jgi:hypothetical protein
VPEKMAESLAPTLAFSHYCENSPQADNTPADDGHSMQAIDASVDVAVQGVSMTPMGLAQNKDTPRKAADSNSSSTESGTAGTQTKDSIRTWVDQCPLDLPTAIRAAIVAMIEVVATESP